MSTNEDNLIAPKNKNNGAKDSSKAQKNTNQKLKRNDAGKSSSAQTRLEQVNGEKQSNDSVNNQALSTSSQTTLAATHTQYTGGAGVDATTPVLQHTDPTEITQVVGDKIKRKRYCAGKRVQAKKLRQAICDGQRALARVGL